MVEKAVGIVKGMFEKSHHEGKDINLLLLNYRNSPVAGLPWSPAQLLYSRNLRSKLPVHPNLQPCVVDSQLASSKMLNHQSEQANWYNRTSQKNCVDFKVGEKVWVKNIKTNVWEKGEIMKRMDIRSYMIKYENGLLLRRNSVYLRRYNDCQMKNTSVS